MMLSPILSPYRCNSVQKIIRAVTRSKATNKKTARSNGGRRRYFPPKVGLPDSNGVERRYFSQNGSFDQNAHQ
jgi:hypothetical protein